MGYLTVLHIRLGAKIGDLHAKDSNAFCKRQMRCDSSLPLPLHLAIIRNDFLIMFPPTATWTRAVGLRGLFCGHYNTRKRVKIGQIAGQHRL